MRGAEEEKANEQQGAVVVAMSIWKLSSHDDDNPERPLAVWELRGWSAEGVVWETCLCALMSEQAEQAEQAVETERIMLRMPMAQPNNLR